jgi:acetyl-CoA acetyltransferase
MPEAVIVEAVRSPIGKRNGGLSGVHPADLSAQVLNGLIQKAGVDPEIGSHDKAAAAQDSGAFDSQIVAIGFHDGSENRAVLKDEGIRRGTPMEKTAQLKPAFKETGVIHAGNSSQISDGSAALLFMSVEKAKSLKLNPIAKVHTATLAGELL